MEYVTLSWILLLWNPLLTFLVNAEDASVIEDTTNGVWAFTAREEGIWLTNRDFTEVEVYKSILFANTDVTFDPITGLFIYCIPGDAAPYPCLLHRTSLDTCHDEHFLTIPMEYVYGMEVDPKSRLLYISAIDAPGICEINLETLVDRTFWPDEENVNYLRISSNERYLYWNQFSNDDPSNNIRRGNIDGTGTPETILTRSNAINGFGIDYAEDELYFSQGATIYRCDMDGNNIETIHTNTDTVWEMSIINKFIYWGNMGGIIKRLSIMGDPSSNVAETLSTALSGKALINHGLVTRAQLDAGRAVLLFSSSSYSTDEAEQSITIIVNRTGNLLRCSCVDVVVIPGSRRITRATMETTLNFTANEASRSLTLTWTDDEEPNGPDEISASLIVNSDDVWLFGSDAATVIIHDDDCGYYLAESDVIVFEDSGFVDISIRRNCTGDMSQAFADTIDIEAVELDGTAQSGFDFVSGPIQAIFTEGSSSSNVRVPLFDNDQPEDAERFVVRLLSPDNGQLLESNVATVTILDHDNVYVIKESQYVLMESDQSLDIVIQRIGNVSQPGSVRLRAREQTAEHQSDFVIEPSSEVIYFPADIPEITVQIAITDDDILESNETFGIYLHQPMEGHLDERKEAVVSIVDDEVEVALSDSRYSCLESRQCEIQVVRRGYLDQTSTAHVQTENLSAFAGTDFVAVDRMLTFAPWVMSIVVQVTLIDDEDKEPHANFIVLINDVSNGMVGEPGRANVALWDDDSELPMLVYSIERTSYSARESDGELKIVVLRGGSFLGVTGSVRLEILPESGASTVNGEDFANSEIIVTFEEGDRAEEVTIVIVNDGDLEEIEDFIVELSDAINGVIGDPARAVLTLEDDDALYSIDKPVYNINENSEGLALTVYRTGYLHETGFVTIQVTGGNATYEADYAFSPIGVTLQFNPEETSKSTVFQIINDFATEQTEIVDIKLSRPRYGSLGNPSSVVIVIEDDDVILVDSTTPEPEQGQQIDILAISLIIVGAVVIVTVLVIACTCCTILLYRNTNPSSSVFPQPQFGSPSYNAPPQYSPYGRNPYFESKPQKALDLYNTNNPMFAGDFYGLGSNPSNRSVFDRPGINGRRLALPSTESTYIYK